jgi:mevalonate kinase
LTPQVPSKEQIAALKALFAHHEPTAAQGLAAICYLAARILPEFVFGAPSAVRSGLRIDVRSLGLPVGAGLGSSAAFSVASAATLLRLRHNVFHDLGDSAADFDEAELVAMAPSRSDPVGGCPPPSALLHVLNEWSFCKYDLFIIRATNSQSNLMSYHDTSRLSLGSEVIIHGEPSGLDNTTSCYGGAVKLNKTLGKFEKLSPLPAGVGILLTNTRVPRSTKDLVAKVRRLKEDLPDVVRPLLDAVEGISQEFLSLLSA